MKGIKTDIKTEWKNYVIKADADKARYHKVEYGVDSLTRCIIAKGLVPGKKYTVSGRIRANIQETNCRTLLELTVDTETRHWYTTSDFQIAGKGDIDQFCTITFTPPEGVKVFFMWGFGVPCMRPEWHYVPHEWDYYIFEHVMVNEGDKPLPYIDPE